jgi:hypothetical protein
MAEWLRELAVGEWYKTDGEPFEIVGVDPKGEIVLVQHFDGTLEEFDFDTWMELSARPCAPPEDYSGALDFDKETVGDFEVPAGRSGGRWENPLDLLDINNL